MNWITRAGVKVDRVACPWLIRKFIDRDAEFLFVPTEQVAATAEREKANRRGPTWRTPGFRCSRQRPSGD
jgi:hypothetical protein